MSERPALERELVRLRKEHPRVYAARHVILALAQVLAAVLGLRLLLPRLDLSFLPRIDLPRVDLPALPRLDLPRIPWPDLPGHL